MSDLPSDFVVIELLDGRFGVAQADNLKLLEDYDNRLDAEQDAFKLWVESHIAYNVASHMEALVDSAWCAWSINQDIGADYFARTIHSAIGEYNCKRLKTMLEKKKVAAIKEADSRLPSSPADM